MDIDLAERLFKFSVEVINFLTGIKNIPELTVVKY